MCKSDQWMYRSREKNLSKVLILSAENFLAKTFLCFQEKFAAGVRLSISLHSPTFLKWDINWCWTLLAPRVIDFYTKRKNVFYWAVVGILCRFYSFDGLMVENIIIGGVYAGIGFFNFILFSSLHIILYQTPPTKPSPENSSHFSSSPLPSVESSVLHHHRVASALASSGAWLQKTNFLHWSWG